MKWITHLDMLFFCFIPFNITNNYKYTFGFKISSAKVRKHIFVGGANQSTLVSPPPYAWHYVPIYSRGVQLCQNYNHALKPIHMS